MRRPLRLAYDAAARIAQAATAIAPASGSKLARAFADRRGLAERYVQWGATHRDRKRDLLWVHAPSVGEGLMARPVLRRMRATHPETQLAYTWFSPSAMKFAEGLDVDFRDYLPLDSRSNMEQAVEALSPAAIVYSKLDVWPNLNAVAAQRGVKLGLISATLSEGSSRRGGLARALLRDAYAALDAVGAIDADDADRLVDLGVRRAAIEITGDTGFDQVWERASRIAERDAALAPLRSDRPTLIAGSTWPSDEAVLLPAFAQLARSNPGIRLLIAPHEPDARHVAPVLEWARRENIDAGLLSNGDAGGAVVIIDRIGLLGDLYSLGQMAFIGGGFHDAGLHAVLEPASFGLPVVFGPQFRERRDARLLLAADGAASVSSIRSLVETLSHWLRDESRRAEVGASARSVVESGLGAAERTFQLVTRLLG